MSYCSEGLCKVRLCLYLHILVCSALQPELLALRFDTSGLEGGQHCGSVGFCGVLCNSGPKLELVVSY